MKFTSLNVELNEKKIENELLCLEYMPKDEYKKLIKTYMNELIIPHITAKQYICLKHIKQFEYENNIKYDEVFSNFIRGN